MEVKADIKKFATLPLVVGVLGYVALVIASVAFLGAGIVPAVLSCAVAVAFGYVVGKI